jgi:uncharacterized protein YlaI
MSDGVPLHVYMCEHCGGIFTSGWTDAEAESERDRLWADAVQRGEAFAVICDDCHKRFMAHVQPERAP